MTAVDDRKQSRLRVSILSELRVHGLHRPADRTLDGNGRYRRAFPDCGRVDAKQRELTCRDPHLP